MDHRWLSSSMISGATLELLLDHNGRILTLDICMQFVHIRRRKLVSSSFDAKANGTGFRTGGHEATKLQRGPDCWNIARIR